MSKPLVSAIIAAYNEEERIGRAIDSVLAQTCDNVEVVVVDDGSTDNTAEVVRQGYPQVKLLVQENAGPQAARNRAAHAASGQFLTLLDADDEWAPEKTERQLDLMVNNPQVGVVATNGIVRCGSLTHPWASPKVPRIYEFSVYQIAHRREPVGASVMFRTEAFERVGGWDESLPAAETVDVIFRMMASGYRFLYLNEPLYIIHRKPQSRGQRGSAVRMKGKLAVLSKLDPGRRPAGRPPLLSEHQYGVLMSSQILHGAYGCIREGEDEAAHECMRRIEELPRAPLGARLLHRLSKRDWRLFVRALSVVQRLRRRKMETQEWGVFGIRQERERRREMMAEVQRAARAGAEATD